MLVTNAVSATRGARVVLASALVSVVLWLVTMVVYRLLPVGTSESVYAAVELTWLVVSVLLLVGVLMLAGSVDRPGPLWALGVAVGVSSALSLGQTLLRIFVQPSATWWSLLGVPSMLVDLTERGLFLWCVVVLAGATRRSWTVPLAVVSLVVALVRFTLSGAMMAAPVLGLDVVQVVTSGWYPWFQSGSGMVGVGVHVALCVGLLAGVSASGAPAPSSAAAPPPPTSSASDLVIGGVLLLVGLGVTVGSYVAASSSSSGGRYVVATGLIGVGLVRLIRGVVRS
ncbi:MAG: hypothetical protein MUC96_05680 [Myxococcaceae bacterium]|jgi:hypothetical protein|nr:hypothetical protein [Myxococcaceae bacterium]